MNDNLRNSNARLVDAANGATLSGASLEAAVAALKANIEAMPGGMVVVLMRNTLPSVLHYLAAWESRRPICLLGADVRPTALTALVTQYRPVGVLGLDGYTAAARPPAGFELDDDPLLGMLWRTTDRSHVAVHPDLALLMTTSGSTGSTKLVRLSRSGVLANVKAICSALEISGDHVAITSLPMNYSYGLSVLNTHLAAGATVVISRPEPLSARFWDTIDRFKVTSLAGVPYIYETLARLSWTASRHPTLEILTQAGGKLSTRLIEFYHEMMSARSGRFYVMWGQTEASPRISVLHPRDLPFRLGSVGKVLRCGSLSVLVEHGETDEPGTVGELVLRGSNVMMGYATSADDLIRGDDCGGVLRTGDVGQIDADGFVWLSGRRDRTIKLAGERVNLDDIEDILSDFQPLAVADVQCQIVVFIERGEALGAVQELLESRVRIHRSSLAVRVVDQLPRLANGKPDYQQLRISDTTTSNLA
jgi:acyl-coenzyme A synthetase/AMP-(fatty) acid ligase